MDAAHLAACSFEAWYPRFQSVTFRSAVLPLPRGFPDFLVQDGVFVPSTSAALPRRGKVDAHAVRGVDYTDWSSCDEDSDSDGATQPNIPVEQFAGFARQIDAAIAALGGKVLPKLNWSAPKDAAWVTATNTIACSNADEVLLLLQSSDRIAHDVCHAFDGCTALNVPAAVAAAVTGATLGSDSVADSAAPGAAASASRGAGPGEERDSDAAGAATAAAVEPFEREAGSGSGSWPPTLQRVLVLRAWRELRPGREFRCFVRDREIVGISQRDVTQRFDHLAAATERAILQRTILAFHVDHVQAAFPLPDYTYDVYITSRSSVRLIDFNPVGGATALLLFADWGELGYGMEAPAGSAAGAERDDAAAMAPLVAAAAAGCGRPDEAAEAAEMDARGQASGRAAAAVEAADAGAAAASFAAASLENGQSSVSVTNGGVANGIGHSAAAERGGSNERYTAGSGSSTSRQQQVDFRVIDEPVVMRSAAQGYAVPYDFVDSGVTGALADFVASHRNAGS